jgi:hypothetical protein
MTDFMRGELGAPKVVDRSTFHAELDALLVREKGPFGGTHRSRAFRCPPKMRRDPPLR